MSSVGHQTSGSSDISNTILVNKLTSKNEFMSMKNEFLAKSRMSEWDRTQVCQPFSGHTRYCPQPSCCHRADWVGGYITILKLLPTLF